MKIYPLAVLALIGPAAAGIGRPQVAISIKDGNFEGLDGLDPTVSWDNSNTFGDVDVEYGVEASARPTTEVASIFRKVWGRAHTEVADWGVSARADVDGDDLTSANLELEVENEDLELSAKVVATAGTKGDKFVVRGVEIRKDFDIDLARLTVNPRYNVENNDGDVILNYDNDGTGVQLKASLDSQQVTVSRQIDEMNRVAPTLTSAGEVAIEYERKIGESGAVIATVKPNDSIDVEWKDSDWTANINMPMDGRDITGANVRIKRDVRF